MRIIVTFELNCLRGKQQQLGASQRHLWNQDYCDDITAPPPYCQYGECDVQPGAGLNLVCHCSIHCSVRRAQVSLENRTEPKLHKTRNSVKKMMKPMTSMFKSRQEHRSRRAKDSPMEATPLQESSNPLDELVSPMDQITGYPSAGYSWGELSELPGNDPILGWQTNNIAINELDAGREASELDGRPLGLHNRRPQPFYQSQVASNPVSPISYPTNPIHSPLGAIDTMMFDRRREGGHRSIEQAYTVPGRQAMHVDQLSLITSPISPDLSESPMLFHSRMEAPSFQRLSRGHTVPRPPVGHDVDNDPIELDAGLDKYRVAVGDQIGGSVTEAMPLRPCEFDDRVVESLAAKKVDDTSRTAQPYGHAEFPYGSVLPMGEHAFWWSSWNEPHRREVLLRSMSFMIKTLPQSVKMNQPMLQNGAEASLKGYDNKLRSAWDNGEVQLVEKHLPLFLHGWWLSLMEESGYPFSATNQWLSFMEKSGYRFSLANPYQIVSLDHVSDTSASSQPTSPKVEMPQRRANIPRSRKRKSEGLDDGNFAHRTSKSSPFEQWPKPHTRKPAPGSMSPPLMTRHYSSSTNQSSISNESIWTNAPGNVSQMDTPSTEYSSSDELLDFDRCQVEGCKATFTGETLDARKGNYTRHMKATHGCERLHCTLCSTSYNRSDNLLAHYRRCHPEHRVAPAKPRQKRRHDYVF